MSDSPQDFDLKFLPDWLKESPSADRYADYEGEAERPRRERDDRRPPRADRPPERRGPRPPHGDRPRGPRPDRPPGDRPRRDDRRADKRPFDRRSGPPSPPREAPQPAPAELRVEFLPEPNAAAGIARQIKASARAYAVFNTAKLFLERPERHRVRITSAKADAPLHQIGDGPVSFDRAAVERGAFLHLQDDFYAEETVQSEPIKGSFSNVARVRSTGALLGPTNHHGYQPALRKIYEERFSRRISFQEFQQQEIEIVSDEQTVAGWKEQARTSKTYTTTRETEPITFKSASEAEQHFRKTYLPTLVKTGAALECNGPASRTGLDRHVNAAVRAAWENERLFPQGLVNALRPYFVDAGLHFFKHRKRVLHVSAIKPVRHPGDQPFSDGIAAIFKAIEAQPRIKRPQLAAKILGPGHDVPEAAPRKEQLASDLHYLVQIGYVIEFAGGSFDLPLSPKSETPAKAGGEAPHPEPEDEVQTDTEPPEIAETPEASAETPEPAAAAAIPEAGSPVEALPEPASFVVAEHPEPPPEEPVPGEEEGEADPSEAARLLPIPPDTERASPSNPPAPTPASTDQPAP